uniref:Uncharacterized protein n=1 Tax=Anopheles merus TaxID=30066 RepID=A0A182V630_ANOME
MVSYEPVPMARTDIKSVRFTAVIGLELHAECECVCPPGTQLFRNEIGVKIIRAAGRPGTAARSFKNGVRLIRKRQSGFSASGFIQPPPVDVLEADLLERGRNLFL